MYKAFLFSVQCFSVKERTDTGVFVRKGCGYDNKKHLMNCQGKRNNEWTRGPDLAIRCCSHQFCNFDNDPELKATKGKQVHFVLSKFSHLKWKTLLIFAK